VRNRVVGQAAQDETGQQLREVGKMAGTRLQNAMVGAYNAARARCDAPATPDCLMARMVPSKPWWQNFYHKTPPRCARGGRMQEPKGQPR
jgi:hypothetical protein